MLAYAQTKVLFIHIPRTGGTTLCELLRHYLPEPVDLFLHHDGAHTMESGFFDQYADYLKFAFVRNPWDRWVSWYALSCMSNMRQMDSTFSFAEFIDDYEAIRVRLGFENSFFYNQLDYIVDCQGKLVCDVIGRYENYASEVSRVFKRLGIHIGEIPALNRSMRTSYHDYYDAQLQGKVAQLCQRDIDYFGYTF